MFPMIGNITTFVRKEKYGQLAATQGFFVFRSDQYYNVTLFTDLSKEIFLWFPKYVLTI